MNKLILILLIVGIHACAEKHKSEKSLTDNSQLENFDLVENFNANKADFKTTIYELTDFSTDGGALTLFRSDKKDYTVFDFWLYGESGKLNYTYWTDSLNNFKFVKQVSYDYDRPYYEEGFLIDSTVNYLSYNNSGIKLFDKNKSEVTDIAQIEAAKADMESFFNEVTEGIDLHK